MLRDPLFHFLAGGALLFLAYGWLGGGDEAGPSDVIVVDRRALLEFVQNRSKAFDPKLAAARLDSLSEPERRLLLDDFLREEALHREALALGLENDDYVIRRRLVQKLEFVAQGFAEAAAEPDAAEVERFFEQNRADYGVAPSITFAQVFFDAEERGREGATRAARDALVRLQRDRVPFSEATRYGDRFLYHVNYVERTPDYVASHFGAAMARELFAMDPERGSWVGPFESPYGAHLALVTNREDARAPELDEIRGRVAEDARRARLRELTDAAIRDIVARYDVRYELEGWAPGSRP